MAITNDLYVFKLGASDVRDRLNITTLGFLVFVAGYLVLRYRVYGWARIIRVNSALFLWIGGMLAVELLVHGSDGTAGLRAIAYAGSAILSYLVFAAYLAQHERLMLAWIKVTVAFSAILGMTAVLSSIGVTSVFGLPLSEVSEHELLGVYPTGGVLQYPLALGTQMVLGLCCSFYLLEKRVNVVRVLCMALILAGLVLSMARGAWLAALVGTVYYVNTERVLRRPWYAFVFVPSILAVSLYVVYVVAITKLPFLAEILRLERGLSGRAVMWDFALDLIQRRPLTGYGLMTFSELKWLGGAAILRYAPDSSFHNNFIDMALQSGLVVATFYIAVFVLPLWRVARSKRVATDKQRFLIFLCTATLVSVMFVDYNIGGLRPQPLLMSSLLGAANLLAVTSRRDA